VTELRDGLVIVDKPAGMTSHDVVAQVRKAAGTRKVGHAGTLDPMATGVLVLGIGRATRLLGYLAAHTKSYTATIRLGQSTVTDDAEGELVAEVDAAEVSDEAIKAAVAGLTGAISQVPAAVSAIKVGGKRSYRRVREGEDVELAPRNVTIERFDVLRITRDGSVVDVDVAVDCSSGTYIRALARDVGRELGVGGHLTRLRRTASGMFTLDEAMSLESLSGGVTLLPLAAVVSRALPTITLDASRSDGVRHGRAIPIASAEGQTGVLGAFDKDGEVLALMEARAESLRVVAGFSG
jgi:tRNA pseudouridine55 synthase